MHSQELAKSEESEDKKVQTEGSITESKLIPIGNQTPEWKLNFYGFVKSDYVYTTHATLSYGRENLVAPNQAKRHVQRDDSVGSSNIQLGDSRLGFKSEFGKILTGVIELDFIDFDKSSPNVNIRPRLRQSYFTLGLDNGWEFFAGQKWDIFSPLNPDTYNIINNLFYNGNVGWIREQFGLKYKFSDDFQTSLALGNGSVNTSASPNVSLEKSKRPTLAFQLKWNILPKHSLYFSGIRTTRTYYNPDVDSTINADRPLVYDGSYNSFLIGNELGKSSRIRRDASGLSLGSEHKFLSEKIILKWEANWGRNLSDLNVLGIGQAQLITSENRYLSSPYGAFIQTDPSGLLNASNPNSLRKYNQTRTEVLSILENGIWFSTIYKHSSQWEYGIFGGVTRIRNSEDLSPAFSDSKGTMRDFSKTQADPENGIWTSNHIGRLRENRDIGFHITYIYKERLKIFFQHEHIRSFYYTPSRNRGVLAYVQSVNIDTGEVILREVKPSYQYSSAVAGVHVLRFGVMMSF